MDITTSQGRDTGRPEGGDSPLGVTPARLVSLPHAESWTSWRVRLQAGGDPAAGNRPPPVEPRARASLALLVVFLLAGLAIAVPDKMMSRAHKDPLPCDGSLKKIECRVQGKRPDPAARGAPLSVLAQYGRADRERPHPSPVTAGR